MSNLTITHAGTDQSVTRTGPIAKGSSLGQEGAILIKASTVVTSLDAKMVFTTIQFLEDTTFTLLTPESTDWYGSAAGATGIDANGDNTGSVTFPAGMTIHGRWTAITPATGKCVAYWG
jgi:hypothetical protein